MDFSANLSKLARRFSSSFRLRVSSSDDDPTSMLVQDDGVQREQSINPTALHVTDAYTCFPTRAPTTDATLEEEDEEEEGSGLPKVLVLFCGGTLIMKENEDGSLIVNDKDTAIDLLLNLEPRLCGRIVSVLHVQYIENIDSSNMTPEIWDTIGEVISNKYDQYDGFVVTHGTDTMAYTSSALSFILQDLGKPVVVTGAQIPGSRIETDARRNFVNAVRVATLDRAGVMLVFDGDIILGARAHKLSESKLDAFGPINWGLLGEVRIDIRFNDEDAKPRHDRPLVFKPGFDSNVVMLTIFPGFPPEQLICIIESGNIKGLVLRAYGSGNISYKFMNAIKLATQKGIIVVVTTQCLEGATLMHLYDVGRQALKSGAIQAYDMSTECVVTKLMWAIHQVSLVDVGAYDLEGDGQAGETAKATSLTRLQLVEHILHTNFTGEINLAGRLYGAKT